MDLLSDLNEPQRRAVQHVDGPLLVLAGAGSGKTRVITRRVAHLIQEGAPPRGVLAITFTNKAAREMLQRVEALQTPPGSTICTFHSLCARLLREFSGAAGLGHNFSIYDSDDQLRLTKEAMERLGIPPGDLQPSRIHASISRAKNALQTPQACADEARESHYMRTVAEVYNEYERLLAANNALDFDDLLLRMAYLLRDHPEVRDLLGSRYRYLMVDEYQDTNRAQYILAHGIALAHGNLCVTGDPDQSIYAWRGANINNILDFEQDYPEATVIRLEENYRSTAAILGSASKLISHNRARKDKALWTRRQGGASVYVLYCDDEHAEAAEVVRRIQLHRRRGGQYGDVAVFYRVNWLSRVMEQALRRLGVPYQVARGVEFYNRKEVRDVLAYLKLMVNPADDLACVRVINTPSRGIGAATVGKLRAFAEASGRGPRRGSLRRGAPIGMLASCRRAAEAGLSAAAAKRVTEFAHLIESLAADVDRRVRAIVEDVILRSGLEEALRTDDPQARQAADNLAEMITSAAEFDQTSEGGTLEEYLHQVSLVSDVDFIEGAGGAVTLMTLHAAKGLEFPVVFVIGCEDGLLPFRREGNAHEGWSSGGQGFSAEAEEERRLAFVGMTRAKQDLTLSCARRRMIRGHRTPQQASGFLTEIGDEFVTVEDLTSPPEPPRRPGSPAGFYAEVDERRQIEAMENPLPPEYTYLKRGSRVYHPKFGAGKVVKIILPWPDTKADIHFEDCGPKRIVLRHAHLELLDENF